MPDRDPFGEQKLLKLQLLMYVIPCIGWIPALWTLYRRQGTREQQSVSRLSVSLTFIWIVAYGLLWFGSLQTSEVFTLRLLYLNGLLTSGYFVVSLGLMLRIWQGKSTRLPNKF